MIADDTTGVSSARQTFLLFGTFYVNKIPLFVPLRAFCDVGNLGPAILAKAFQGVVITTGQIINHARALKSPASYYYEINGKLIFLLCSSMPVSPYSSFHLHDRCSAPNSKL
jgi:hypothetical protein